MNFLSALLSLIIGLLLIFKTNTVCALIIGRVKDMDYTPSKRYIFYIKLVGCVFLFLGVASMMLTAFA